MTKTEIDLALEAFNKAAKEFTKLTVNSEIALQRNPLAVKNTVNSDKFYESYSKMTTNLDSIIKSAQSTSITDKFVIWFGIFDKELKALKTKKSLLLAKMHVQNYTYKRHLWNYSTSASNNVADNIFGVMNQVMSVTNYAITAARENILAPHEIDTLVLAYYRTTIDPNISSYLFGHQKGEMSKKLRAHWIGNGLDEKIITVNFQDDMSISEMMDMAEMFHEIDWEARKDLGKAIIKDTKAQIDSIMANMNLAVKSNPKIAPVCTKHIKVCASYMALLVTKLNEYDESDYHCFKTIGDEIISILKGLESYKGE